ncbi:MAG: P-II family nitrogen regulator [Betaproteobacteria bacterium]
MSIKRVIAIIRSDMLGSLEARLKKLQIGGITVSRVKGYGEYRNLYTIDWMSEHAKVEIFIEEAKVDALIEAMLDVAHAEPPGAGIVAVLPVERFLHLRTGTDTLPEAPPL